MKLLLIYIQLLTSSVFAMGSLGSNLFPNCKKRDISVEKQVKTLEFLKSVEGYYRLNDCEVHIDVLTESESPGLLKAEVLIQKTVDEEYYVPIFFIDKRKTKKMNFCLKNYNNLIHYEFKDRNRTGERNYKRHYLLDVEVDPETRTLKHIEAGVRGKDSRNMRWVSCTAANEQDLL